MRAKAETCKCLPWRTWAPSTQHSALTNGHRGFFGRGDMQKEFEEAAFRLNKNEVSGIVETASGVHLIQRSVVSGLPDCNHTDVETMQVGISICT